MASGNDTCASGHDCPRCWQGRADDDCLLLPEMFCGGIVVREMQGMVIECMMNEGRFVLQTCVSYLGCRPKDGIEGGEMPFGVGGNRGTKSNCGFVIVIDGS